MTLKTLIDNESNGNALKTGGRKIVRRVARRCVQAAAFSFFCVLFFYVCCPYPTDAPRTSGGWTALEIDGETGRSTLQNPPFEPILEIDAIRWLVDENAEPATSFGKFRVVATTQDGENVATTLEPVAPLDQERLDSLSMTFGELTVCEQDPDAPPDHCSRRLTEKTSSVAPASTALRCDPTVGFVAAIGRKFDATFGILLAILATSLLFARAFCGWLCPMGTIVDFADFLLEPIRRIVAKLQKKRNLADVVKRERRSNVGIGRYFLLAALVAAVPAGGAFVGWFAPLPTLTRNVAFLFAPLQTAAFRGWGQVPTATWGTVASIAVLGGFLGLGIIGKRGFCRWICPAGAIFSLLGRLRIFGYSIARNRCLGCRKCERVCSFDAISTTNEVVKIGSTCASCGECAAVCPGDAISFGGVWDEKSESESNAGEKLLERRRTIGFAIGIAASVAGGTIGGRVSTTSAISKTPVVRPPGAVPESNFLRRCVRCGECLRACPNDALQPIDFSGGLARLGTPRLNADWSGCEPSCNNCGRVCPTGAIEPLSIEEKRRFAIGTAVVDSIACLPFAGVEDCRLCVDECSRAGYNAIEFVAVGTRLDENGRPLEDVGFLAPVVLTDRCVGCGLCQARCNAIVVRVKKWTTRPAIRVFAKK